MSPCAGESVGPRGSGIHLSKNVGQDDAAYTAKSFRQIGDSSYRHSGSKVRRLFDKNATAAVRNLHALRS